MAFICLIIYDGPFVVEDSFNYHLILNGIILHLFNKNEVKSDRHIWPFCIKHTCICVLDKDMIT